MNNMFFMFNSLDFRTDITHHPKFKIIINNVSLYGDEYDPDQIEWDPQKARDGVDMALSKKERVNDIKLQLKDGAKAFFLAEQISSNTRIGEKVWKELKTEFCQADKLSKKT